MPEHTFTIQDTRDTGGYRDTDIDIYSVGVCTGVYIGCSW